MNDSIEPESNQLSEWIVAVRYPYSTAALGNEMPVSCVSCSVLEFTMEQQSKSDRRAKSIPTHALGSVGGKNKLVAAPASRLLRAVAVFCCVYNVLALRSCRITAGFVWWSVGLRMIWCMEEVFA